MENKIVICSPAYSVLAQKSLFKEGYKYGGNGGKAYHDANKFICYHSGSMYYSKREVDDIQNDYCNHRVVYFNPIKEYSKWLEQQ